MTSTSEVHRKSQEYVAGRDPVELMSELTPRLGMALAGLDFHTRHRPEGPGQWSVHDVITHLADCEMVYRFRLRAIAAEDAPSLQPFDENLFASRLGYQETPLEESLEILRTLRGANVRWLRAQKREVFERTGMHPERGRETIRDLVTLIAWHDARHFAQIGRIRSALVEGHQRMGGNER